MSDSQPEIGEKCGVPAGEGAGSLVTKGRSRKSALICSSLGLAGWVVLLPFLDPCNQSEQLARFFAGLWNTILIGIFGGMSTVCSLAGWRMSRQPKGHEDETRLRIARQLAIAGLALGGIVVLFCLVTGKITLT